MSEVDRAWCQRQAARTVTAARNKPDVFVDYWDESRAVVLTPVTAVGTPSWRTVADRDTERDICLRVCAAYVEGRYIVAVGGHSWPTSLKGTMYGDQTPPTRADAEQVVIAALATLLQGVFTAADPLALVGFVPAELQRTYVVRPDQRNDLAVPVVTPAKPKTAVEKASQQLEALLETWKKELSPPAYRRLLHEAREVIDDALEEVR